MTLALVYLAIGAVLIGLTILDEMDRPGAYVVALLLWPFILLSVAVSIIADAVRGSR